MFLCPINPAHHEEKLMISQKGQVSNVGISGFPVVDSDKKYRWQKKDELAILAHVAFLANIVCFKLLQMKSNRFVCSATKRVDQSSVLVCVLNTFEFLHIAFIECRH